MSWVLHHDGREIPVEATATFGRDDFNGEAAFSREHFRLKVKAGRLYIRDQGSTNGTFLDGQRLEKGVDVRVRDGSVIRVGRAELRVRAERSALAPTTWVDLAVFAALMVVTFAPAAQGYGRAFGFYGFFLLSGILFLSVLAAGLFWSWLQRDSNWNFKTLARYGCLVALTGFTLDFGTVTAAEYQFKISRGWMPARIEYHCLTKFDPAECAHQVHICPNCALEIDRYKRDLMVKNLAPFRQKR